MKKKQLINRDDRIKGNIVFGLKIALCIISIFIAFVLRLGTWGIIFPIIIFIAGTFLYSKITVSKYPVSKIRAEVISKRAESRWNPWSLRSWDCLAGFYSTYHIDFLTETKELLEHDAVRERYEQYEVGDIVDIEHQGERIINILSVVSADKESD